VAAAGAGVAAGCLGDDYGGDKVGALARPIHINFSKTVVEDTLAAMDAMV